MQQIKTVRAHYIIVGLAILTGLALLVGAWFYQKALYKYCSDPQNERVAKYKCEQVNQ